MNKTYKDLSPQEETEFVLWFGFFRDSLNNAQLQIQRWNQSRLAWDLHMFFVAVRCAQEALDGLKYFLSPDAEVWAILKKFHEKVETYGLRELRNATIHRKKEFAPRDKEGNPLPKRPLLIFGAYHVNTDEYLFGTHRIKLSEAFDLVEKTIQDIRKLFADRLAEFYRKGNIPGMISFPELRSFAADSNALAKPTNIRQNRNLDHRMTTVRVWHDKDSDFLEVTFEEAPATLEEIAEDVFERRTPDGRIIGFAIFNFSKHDLQTVNLPLAVVATANSAG